MGLLENISGALEASGRVLDTMRVFSSNGFTMLISAVNGKSPNAPQVLRKVFEELGATYIKLGQLIASAPGIFPDAYVKEMQHCLDNAKPIPFSEIEKVLKSEFGNEYHKIFKTIERKPLASASIAQVHAATLKNGEDVVIKVQRPGISGKLNADLNLIYLAAQLFERLTPGAARASLTEIVKQFQETIVEETDFYKEAKNISEFNSFLNDYGEDRVIVPKVYSAASTLRVLTMSRLYGVPLTDLASIKKYTKEPEETLITALNTWFASLMYCGFFHADVHAGNLMVLTNGQIAFLDFGIVGRMTQTMWNALMDFTQAIGREDFSLMARALKDLNATDKEVDIDKFAKSLKELFHDFNNISIEAMNPEQISEAQINELMMNLVSVAEENGLRFPREFALLFKQMLYFDRYVQILAPDLNIASSPEIKKIPKKNVTNHL